MDPTIVAAKVGGWFGLAGAFVGAVLAAEVLQRWREGRREAEERRQVAGALAAELRGLAARWGRMAPNLRATAGPVVWSAEEDYFPVYDGIGRRLRLLPPDLAEEVVPCYVTTKGTIDSLRGMTRLMQYAALSPYPAIAARAADIAGVQKDPVCSAADELVAAMEASLLPRLDKVAKGAAL